jgi:hypothetical protein
MVIRPGIYCDKTISGSLGFKWVAFECAPLPVASAIEIHRAREKPILMRFATGLLEAAVAGTILNRE